MGSFAGVALLLAVLDLYGVLAYTVPRICHDFLPRVEVARCGQRQ